MLQIETVHYSWTDDIQFLKKKKKIRKKTSPPENSKWGTRRQILWYLYWFKEKYGFIFHLNRLSEDRPFQ